ncbi:MAG TPA: hypothetical protein VFZ53_24755, partial [Polyangiaceae bacterium]
MLSTRSFRSLSSPVVAFLFEAAASNTLVRFASVLALGAGMTRCVPAKSYDEARTAAESELTAHGRTRQRLEAAHERIRTLEQSLAERERALETGESSVAAAKLETVVASKDKEAAMDLVEQLRSELARTGNHLVAFSDEKRDLARAVMLAEERVKSLETAEKNIDELLATAGDLSVALGATAKDQGIELGARDGQIVLSIPAAKLFADGADALVVDAVPVLGAVSTVTNEHPRIRVVLAAPQGDERGAARVMSLGQALVERGLPQARLEIPAIEPKAAPVATESAPSPAPAEG